MSQQYDETQTRRHVIAEVLDEALRRLEYKRYPMGTAPGRINGDGMIVEVAPEQGQSLRSPSTMGRGIYTWTDAVAIKMFFRVATDDQEALAERSQAITHEIEREIERYRLSGTAQVDNQEVMIGVESIEVIGEVVRITLDKDRGSVVVALRVNTFVQWK